MREEQIKKKARMLSDIVNCFGTNPKELCEEFSHEHRTLKQNLTRLATCWLETMAETTRYDMRDEASVALGKEFVSKIENRYLPYI